MKPLALGELAEINEATVEDYSISDAAVLEYASQILLEEDPDENAFMFREPSLLEVTERSLYEAIGEMYEPPPGHRRHLSFPGNFDEGSPDEGSASSGGSNYGDALAGLSGGDFISHELDHEAREEIVSASRCYTSSDCSGGINNDAIEFLPLDGNNLLYLQSSGSAKEKLEVPAQNSDPGKEVEDDSFRADGPHRKKNPLVEEDRSRKQLQRYSELEVRSEIFDKVLLCSREREAALREAFQRMVLSERAQAKGLSIKVIDSAKKGRWGRRDIVDLQTMLTLCAQAVSTDDRRDAADKLKRIRQHASPTGDGMQRLAYYFTNGLEARITGYGTEIYNSLIASWPVTDVLKYYHLFLAIFPFRKLANYFSNKTIVNLAENSDKVHIVYFGNCYGFQWPSLMQRLSYRAGGPPELRLTAIDFPQPGFRPVERLEASGHRLASYAETFKVPFKYDAIAAKWGEVKIEDIRIETNEVTIVNCVSRLEDLLDESVGEESPRDAFLNLIRKINPQAFIQGIVNGGHGSPFFISRFREALFHFSAIFDMLDAMVPRDNPERMMIERETFGRKVMNVIACEGLERIHRPEIYKKWHLRNVRAGFAPLPLDRQLFNIAKDKIARCYHKDFEIEEDGGWLLQGWKGRIVHALSAWKPSTLS